MNRLPEPPAGSRFTLAPNTEGRTRLCWPSLGREHPYWGGVVFLTVWLCGWTVGEVFASLLLLGRTLNWEPMRDQAQRAPLLFLVGWLGGWTIGGIFAWRTWLTLVLGSRTESLTFGDGDLVFRPGLTAAFVTGAANGSLSGTASREPRVVRRGQVAACLRLEPVGERQRLSIDCGADRVEVGAGLNPEERQWLHRLLKEWAGEGKGEFGCLDEPITPRQPGAQRRPSATGQTPDPPEGSRFTMGQTDEGHYRISWPSGESGWERWGGAAFIAFWLCGWVVGEVVVLSVLAGRWLGWGPANAPGPGDCAGVFLVVWLAAWTVGGLAAARILYLLVCGKSRECVTLGIEMSHEPASLPPNDQESERPAAPSLAASSPRRRTISREQVASGLLLDRVGERQRLTVDCGADRVEIGAALREPEREWPHAALLAWAGPPEERLFGGS